MADTPRHVGFTLIELSIVLVIIGLVTASILVGRDLIHSAELRKLVSEEANFITALRTFEGKYKCEPGDCPNADAFFGAECGDSSTDPMLGCNGNGDYVTWTTADVTGRGEIFKAWTHLSLANLIAGHYVSHLPASAGGIAGVAGVNIPISSAMPSLAWNYTYCNDMVPIYAGSLLNSMCLGGYTSAAATVQEVFAITLSDAQYIDSKLDDGIPVTGKIRGVGEPSFSLCSGNNYLQGNPPETQACTLAFFQ